eukprot:7544037-Lingulodinium_polyedra.AAC.1
MEVARQQRRPTAPAPGQHQGHGPPPRRRPLAGPAPSPADKTPATARGMSHHRGPRANRRGPCSRREKL